MHFLKKVRALAAHLMRYDGALFEHHRGAALRQNTVLGSDKSTVLPRNDWSYRVVLSQPIFAGRRELRAYEGSDPAEYERPDVH